MNKYNLGLYDLLMKRGIYCTIVTPMSVSLDGGLGATFEGKGVGIVVTDRDGNRTVFSTIRDAVAGIPAMITDSLWAEFRRDCRQIADECAEEGFPGHGTNYDLRVEGLYRYYEYHYGFEFTGEEEE